MIFHKLLFLLAFICLTHSQMAYMTSVPSVNTLLNNTCRLISVSGSGTANGVPDTAVITIGVSARANTSINALGQMNGRARELLTILTQYNIPSANIQTSSLTLGPDYNYANGSQVLIGQRAAQSFTIRVRNIGNGSIIGSIVDAATNIQNISVSGLTFDINNKTSLLGTANRNAWDDAFAKAAELASLSGVRLGRANKIRIQGEPSVIVTNYNQLVGANAQGAPTQISVGNYGVTTNINVDFLIA